MPIPDIQIGRSCRQAVREGFGWLHDVRRDFREMADPTVIRFGDKWYLYPSAGMCWVSSDLLNWQHHPIEPFDAGYAPTVVQHSDGWLYLTACSDRMYRASHPLGPWEDLGTVTDEAGHAFRWSDPMLLSDRGDLYCYHGLGTDGIYVAKLRRDRLTHFDGPRQHCFAFNPDHHWERKGEYNQDPTRSFIEGAWVTHRDGRYYLQYSANGTEWRNYAVGCYVADHPLGPWSPQRRNPILVAPRGQGIVNGCAHHSVVEGPGGTLWAFYTTLVRNHHAFERRIGMDPVKFDDAGEMYIAGPTETPQFAPGVIEDSSASNDAGLVPLTVNQPVSSSAYLPGREPVYATDDSIRTAWEAPPGRQHWLRVDLQHQYSVEATRVIFGDAGLDYTNGVVPGPYRYVIEHSQDGEQWHVAHDASQNRVEQHIRYDTFLPVQTRFVRLRVLEVPDGMRLSVLEFTAFGRCCS